ncbi:TetR/AcrR family transcriptional regulator [Limibacillus halophilus]|uniref:TetR/AcrR family transcriptional repressor of nem operon n=1 Tax=Limibacillus halophilus TaxID=1579333 RepID=A0A839SWQ8_9PROT|nr:TetR/AcrR family transcriptional regulator [Limibacillus halophilus]MBB3065385.1 TetR/AcrR family transcriptional repressor of nem operon [Limibacillus halophilus]
MPDHSTIKRAHRGRGRPLEFDRATAVRQALDAFWRRGYQGVSVTDLAEVMSITRTSFYNSFGDRQSVFKEALDVYRREAPDSALADIPAGVAVVPAVRQVFRNICRARIEDPEARGCLVVNTLGQMGNLEGEVDSYLKRAISNGTKVIERLLSQAVEQGEIPPIADLKAASKSFVAFLIGLNTLSKVVRDESQLWDLCENFLERYGF